MQRVLARCCSISLYAVGWGVRLEIIDEVKACKTGKGGGAERTQ